MTTLGNFISMVYRSKTLRRIVFNWQLEEWAGTFKGTVLDLGAGSLDSLSPWVSKDVKIIATDTHEREGMMKVDLNQTLPFDEGTIDVATLFFVLYILEDARSTLREIHRVLKPGGKLYLAVPLIAPEIPEPHDYVRWTYEGLERMFKEAGFTQWSIERSGGRASSAVILLHPFFVFNTVRLVVFSLALLVDRLTRTRDYHHPAPHSYFCVLTK